MANIPEVYLLQATKKNLEQAKAFQDDMGAHFFEHTMYDVKDALTSILALCDMEDMKQVPQVKKSIQRVTDLLHDVRLYYNSSLFNVNHVLINVINVLKKNFKGKIHIDHDLTYIKALTESNQDHLELILLYPLIEAVQSSKEAISVKIQLAQKERDAVISIRFKNFHFSSVILKEIEEFHDQTAFKMKLSWAEEDTELVIRLPLSFEKKGGKTISTDNLPKITLGKPKRVKKTAMHGAQERT